VTGTADTAHLARAIRRDVLKMVHRANASHVGTCLSSVDLIAVLYNGILRVDPSRPDWGNRDRLILSKGHGAAALYAALAETDFFPREWLDRFCEDGAPLAGHATHRQVPGVEVSTGSLGHGLPIACGIALAGARNDLKYRVFTILGDGECDEGSVWEAALFAPHHSLDNLTAIVDHNKLQSLGFVSEVVDLEPLAEKWRSFGWAVREIDGHDLAAIRATLTEVPFEPGKPSCVVAHTVKGKGVSFMENQLAWHYRSPDTEQLRQALAELECTE